MPGGGAAALHDWLRNAKSLGVQKVGKKPRENTVFSGFQVQDHFLASPKRPVFGFGGWVLRLLFFFGGSGGSFCIGRCRKFSKPQKPPQNTLCGFASCFLVELVEGFESLLGTYDSTVNLLKLEYTKEHAAGKRLCKVIRRTKKH